MVWNLRSLKVIMWWQRVNTFQQKIASMNKIELFIRLVSFCPENGNSMIEICAETLSQLFGVWGINSRWIFAESSSEKWI